WAMDFTGNLARIRASIDAARDAHATYRLGPELEIPGYGCEDHFLEPDTFAHSWEAIASLVASGHTDGLLVDVGAPVLHRGVAYNARVLLANRRVLLVRPKMALADDGNYREARYFRAWTPRSRPLDEYLLPPCMTALMGQATAPIGDAAVAMPGGVVVACEACEELWTPQAPHIAYAALGVHLIGNGSGSHHELRKMARRQELLRGATAKTGGVYAYANQRGCDGGRLYYDGGALVAVNGHLVAGATDPHFGIGEDVRLAVAAVDVGEVIATRLGRASCAVQASLPSVALPVLLTYTATELRLPCGKGGEGKDQLLRADDDFTLTLSEADARRRGLTLAAPQTPPPEAVEEEIGRGPACWLWDYLRRSGSSGYMLPLSGGADSAATAAIVGAMCQMATAAAAEAPGGVVATDVRRLLRLPAGEPTPTDPRVLARALLHTAYMASARASSAETRERAAAVAADVGAYHVGVDISAIVTAAVEAVAGVLGVAAAAAEVVIGGRESARASPQPPPLTPRFRADGGTTAENIALQNVQARLRMVLTYLLAQLLPWARSRAAGGPTDSSLRPLLVLGSANVDEALRGYLTKYDCSAADVNPIGGVAKADLAAFLMWAARPVAEGGLGYPSLAGVAAAAPTAELEPVPEGETGAAAPARQTDEADMGCTYAELGVFGRLRSLGRCGPVAMFRRAYAMALASGRAGVSGGAGVDGAGGGGGASFLAGASAREVAARVKFFWTAYAANRHKMTTLTPAYHAEGYSPEDNRFDLRPFLYNVRWPWQFRQMDALVAEATAAEKMAADAAAVTQRLAQEPPNGSP
ncbi:hypothetical protein MMPV_009554, partial [Pyropia vietnamensis]